MAFHLVWAPQAIADLDAICSFIARDSEAYAREFAIRLVSAVEVLEDFPEIGRPVPEFPDPSLRELLQGRYRVLYEKSEGVVHVLAIHHAARLLREKPRP